MTAATDIEALMPLNALDILREVNAYLRAALIRMQPERTHCSTIQSQDFSALRHQIRRAAECLRSLPPTARKIGKLEDEASEYASNLQRLSHCLPDLHGRLVAERSRLEVAKTQVDATSAWARATQKTL